MSKKFLACFSIIILAVGLIFLANGLILAWTTPTQAPPGGNTAAPLNVGNTDQTKTGRLNIGGGDAYWISKDGNSFALKNNADVNKFIVGQDGNVGIGTVAPEARLDVTLKPTAVTANSTNYFTALQSAMRSVPISAGAIDSGYRVGSRIESYYNTAEFAGTLNQQFGLWSRVGTYTGSTGRISNSYAAYLETLTSGGLITNAYGIYQTGVGTKNYFAGDVGIGVTAPASKLHIQGSRIDGTDETTLTMFQDASGRGSLVSLTAGTVSDSNPYFAIKTRTTSGSPETQERIRILSNGNVGIGTENPSEKLHVAGNVVIGGNSSNEAIFMMGNSRGKFAITPGGTYPGSEIKLYAGYIGDDFTLPDNGDIVFKTGTSGAAPNERMRIDGGTGIVIVQNDICILNGKCLSTSSSGSGSGSGSGIASCDYCDSRFVNTSGNESINGTLTVNGLGVNGNIAAYNITGNKFIDKDDITFYVDPTGTSWMNEISNQKIITSQVDAGTVNAGTVDVSRDVLMGYEQVYNKVTNANWAAVTCPTGKKLLGGGCNASGNGLLMSNYPTSDVRWFCSTNVTGIAAYAFCARIGD